MTTISNSMYTDTTPNNKEDMQMNKLMKTTDSRDAGNFLSILPTAEVQESATTGLCLYTPKGSMVNLPLYIREEDEMIHIIPQDNLQDNLVDQVFGDEAIELATKYSFDKKLVLAAFGEEPEYLPDMIAILETYDSVSRMELLKAIIALKEHSFELVHILRVLTSLPPAALERLLEVYNLRQYFIELEGQIPKDEED